MGIKFINLFENSTLDIKKNRENFGLKQSSSNQHYSFLTPLQKHLFYLIELELYAFWYSSYSEVRSTCGCLAGAASASRAVDASRFRERPGTPSNSRLKLVLADFSS